MFLKDSMILELLASWKYEKQPVITTTAVSTIPRYSCRERERERERERLDPMKVNTNIQRGVEECVMWVGVCDH